MTKQFIQTNFYKITTVVALVALVVFNGNFFAKADDDASLTKDSTTKQTQTSNENSSNTESQEPVALSPNLPNIPASYCLVNLNHWQGGSSIYRSDAPYNNLFMNTDGVGGYSSQMIDVNGDGLQDYIYSFSRSGGSTSYFEVNTQGCVYLNTGSGWTKVFECSAQTYTDLTTGEVLSQNYKGDCAGEPSASKSN